MGICYDLVSDSKKESYDLGKTFWGIFWSDFKDSLISCNECSGSGVIPPGPGINKVRCEVCNSTGRVKKGGFRPKSYEELLEYFKSKVVDDEDLKECIEEDMKYIVHIATNIWKFMEDHPDWKCVDDSNDYSTFDTKEELEEDKIKWPQKDKDWEWPRYIEIGTRYTK